MTMIVSSPLPNRHRPHGTPAGDQARDEFIADLHQICGDVRTLWLPKGTDTTTTTEASRHARVFTYNETLVDFDAVPTVKGSGLYVDFNGTNEEADTPDQANLSFGDSENDSAFSVLTLISPDVNNAAMTIVSKSNSATVDEWELSLTSSGHPLFDMIDASSSGSIGRRDATAIGTSDVFLAATYSGSDARPGNNIWVNAAQVDDTDASSGSYTAMEDTASLVRIGCRYTSNEQFFNGKIGLVAIVGKELMIEELWAIKALINGFFDIAL